MSNRLKEIRNEITVDPTAEPVPVAEIKEHCQIIGTDEDTLIGEYTAAARRAVERYLGMQLMTATYEVGYQRFPGNAMDPLYLPIRPVTAIDSVQYYDTNNTQQTLATSLWDFVAGTPYGYVVPAWNQVWPTTRTMPKAENVTLTFDAGYASADDVPDPIKSAIKMLARDIYDHRLSQTLAGEELKTNPNYKMLLGLYTVHNV